MIIVKYPCIILYLSLFIPFSHVHHFPQDLGWWSDSDCYWLLTTTKQYIFPGIFPWRSIGKIPFWWHFPVKKCIFTWKNAFSQVLKPPTRAFSHEKWSPHLMLHEFLISQAPWRHQAALVRGRRCADRGVGSFVESAGEGWLWWFMMLAKP